MFARNSGATNDDKNKTSVMPLYAQVNKAKKTGNSSTPTPTDRSPLSLGNHPAIPHGRSPPSLQGRIPPIIGNHPASPHGTQPPLSQDKPTVSIDGITYTEVTFAEDENRY